MADVVPISPELAPGLPAAAPGFDPIGLQSPPREAPSDDLPKRSTSAPSVSSGVATASGRGRRKGDESGDGPLQKRPKATPADPKAEKELRYQASLARALSQAAQAERREVRERLRRDSLRLGTFSRGLYGRGAERDAALTWQGGTDWEDLELLRKRIQEQRHQIEKLQLTIKTRQKQLKKTGEETETAEEMEEDLWEQRELLSAKSEALKRDELDLKERERRIYIERFEHVRQFKSVESEDQMSFGGFQPLVKRYQLLRLQSKTSSGNTEVYQAYDVTMLHACLVKIHHLSLDSAAKEERLDSIRQQCEAFRGMKQGCGFASLLDHFELENGSKYVMVWEYCEGEAWEFFILRNSPVMEKEARGMLLQILGAMRVAEKGGLQLPHLDLKPSRLTFRGGEVKINSACFPQLRNSMGKPRSRSHMEVPGDSLGLESQEGDDDPTDALSQVLRVAGAIFYELLFGRPPEARGPEDHAFELPESPSRISQECRDCLCRMLDRETRITVQDIASDPFFAPTKRR